MPTISVIVPVYRAEEYLRLCVESILSQTFTDFELILVDDGSPDNCPRICEEYAAEDERIVVIHQQNQGQSAARNHAVQKAAGDWLCFVDSDDMIHCRMLEMLYNAAVRDHANLSMCTAVEGLTVPEDFNTRAALCSSAGRRMDEDGLEQLYNCDEHRGWVVWGKLIRREIVQRFPFAVGRIYEDNAVVCRWLAEADTVSDIADELYFYRVNQQGTTKQKFSLKYLDSLWALNEMICFFEEKGYLRLKKRFCSQYMRAAIGFYWKVKNELCLLEEARGVKQQMQRMLRANRRYIDLNKQERQAANEILHPRLASVRWNCRVCMQIVKRDGVMALAQKAVRRLRRGG